MGGHFLWVGGCGWEYTLGGWAWVDVFYGWESGWGWVVAYFGWVEVDGTEWV